jgi:hypothetical protein
MSESVLRVFTGRECTVDADTLFLTVEGSAKLQADSPHAEKSAILVDMRLLEEQGLATPTASGWQITWDAWPLAIEFGASSLTSFTAPCHLLLEIDRRGDLGRQEFRYVVRWREGAREVDVERFGAFVRHTATGRVMHLDTRALELLEAIDHFNSLPPAARTQPHDTWSTLETVSRQARALGARLDAHLAGNTVIVPPTLGLIIREDEQGQVSFLPRLPDSPVDAAFTAEFERSVAISDVMTLTVEGGKRVRVLLSEPQQEVLRRMQRVRRIPATRAESLVTDPSVAFDGVIDSIDLTDVTREYGPRVIGIGSLVMPSDVRAEGRGSILDRFRASGASIPENPAEPPVNGPQPAAEERGVELPLQEEARTPRTAVSIDVLEAGSGQVATLRFRDDEALQTFHQLVQQALERGEESIAYDGREIAIETELVTAIQPHLRREAPETQNSGAIGRSGHLYLLINEHEVSLTSALEVAVPEVPPVLAPVNIPDCFADGVALQPHQVAGFEWLAACRASSWRRGAVLADDMGLGKTLQLLTHVVSLIEQGVLDDEATGGRNGPWRPVLIIAPLLLVDSGVWTDEMATRFRDGGRAFEPWVVLRDEGLKKVRRDTGGVDELGKPLLDPAKLMAHKVVITTYETMMAYQHSLAQRVGGRPMWSLVIFDEAQEVKSPKTKQSIAAKALDGMFKVAATGTPVETRLRDLWNLMDTVEPTYLRTQREFVVRYERPAMNPVSPGDREHALQALRSALCLEQPGAYLLRRDKSILRSLPARHEHRIDCPYSPEERAVNDSIRATLSRPGTSKSALAVVHHLHLASQHPLLVHGSADSASVERILSQSGRLQGLLRILRKIEQDGEKALVFARSVEAQRLLARVISEEFHTPVDIVNGQTGLSEGRAGSGAARRAILQRFRQREGFSAIVLSPFVAGVGITLTEANHVIHYGRWWNPAIENQATDRAYRIGQAKPVHVYYLVSFDERAPDNATFDQLLDELLRTRNRLARDFLMPQSDDENVGKLVQMLENSASVDMNITASIFTSRHVAALLCAQATQSGGQAVWLGEDGLYGAQVVRRMNGLLEVVQLQSAGVLSAFPSLTDIEQAWRTLLEAPDVRATQVIESERDGWRPFVSGLTKNGVAQEHAWDDLEAHRDVGAIRAALSRGRR